MANYLMFLSQGGEIDSSSNSSPARVFECKTCNRTFPSFQALGGHRASHKKPRLTGDGSSDNSQSQGSSPMKPKTHECSVCGLEFAIGQALGGHMRRHRAAMNENQGSSPRLPLQDRFSSSSSSSSSPTRVVPVVKKTDNNSRRVLCLDLNLTPLENDIKILQLGKSTVSLVNCFL
ncbi:hypothetical protein FEM48_Zijuj03G0071900 [Ziziphus jujuba var. spinosa]|nr:hypothetical protein FEM48_Zijuj03G0071900 [Ziziphus jujuba var. spinosa]